MGGPAAEMTLKPRFVDEVFIVLRVVDVVAVRNEIAQVPGVFVALALLIVVWVFCAHNVILSKTSGFG